MSDLQNALARVARRVQQYQLLRQKQLAPLIKADAVRAKQPVKNVLPKASKEKLRLVRSNALMITKRRFQKFFDPLNMPLLKIYDENPTPYNASQAEANLAAKLRRDKIGHFNTYLNERTIFTKMLDFLVDMTPAHLKDADTINDPNTLISVLESENTDYLSNQYSDVPRYSFSEIPPIPDPLTKDNFQKYIYTLTHTTFPYRNSSSMTSGIIPDILLSTHHLDNEKFKPFRSVETYNYLIAYFGYLKFQNVFARGLLLVMAKDGHEPNLRTLNELLKICRMHNKSRSLVSTYQVVINYLDLAKKMGLQINLTTWNRVYDCIDNIFFKELLINKILVINLPISDNMCIRILTDYCLTSRDTQQVVKFVEDELRRPKWRENPRLAERVLYHQIVNAKNDLDLQNAMDGLAKDIRMDQLSFIQIARALFENKEISASFFHLLCIYSREELAKSPEVFIALIKGICSERKTFRCEKLGFILRGIIHDATKILKLPIADIDSDQNGSKCSLKKNPYHTPQGGLDERYRMLKRITKNLLTEFEAVIIYSNKKHKTTAPMPWKMLSLAEQESWESLKLELCNQRNAHSNAAALASSIGLEPVVSEIPEKIIAKYQRSNNRSIGTSNDSRMLHKIENGFEEELEKELTERGLIPLAHR